MNTKLFKSLHWHIVQYRIAKYTLHVCTTVKKKNKTIYVELSFGSAQAQLYIENIKHGGWYTWSELTDPDSCIQNGATDISGIHKCTLVLSLNYFLVLAIDFSGYMWNYWRADVVLQYTWLSQVPNPIKHRLCLVPRHIKNQFGYGYMLLHTE
jgi:hypothetical protein